MLYLKNISETFQDFPDKESLAVIAFFYGCKHNCPNCQNAELQQYPGEEALSLKDVYKRIIDFCKRSNTKCIVLSGGDPLCPSIPETLDDMLALISTLEIEGYEVCVYTGYNINYVNSLYDEPLYYYTDTKTLNPPMPVFWKKPSYLKCGRYLKDFRDEGMGKFEDKFVLASKNQRFYYRDDNNEFKPLSESNVIEI